MDFNTTEEQTMLRETVQRYLADTYSFDNRMKTVTSGKHWNPGVWRAFAEELGILGAPFGEAHGGLGGGAVVQPVHRHVIAGRGEGPGRRGTDPLLRAGHQNRPGGHALSPALRGSIAGLAGRRNGWHPWPQA